MRRLVLLSLAFAPFPALAAGATDLTMIDSAVAAFTGQPIGVPGGAAQPVDRRLRLDRLQAERPSLPLYGGGSEEVLGSD